MAFVVPILILVLVLLVLAGIALSRRRDKPLGGTPTPEPPRGGRHP